MYKISIGAGLYFSLDTTHSKMKEIRKDLYTKAEYAKKIGVSRSRVSQMVKDKLLNIVVVNGGELIKVK